MAKVLRKIIEIDEELCDGCGQCVPACAEGAIQIIDGKARLVGERFCDGLGACMGECPTGALRIIEREAEEFDEEAVEEYLNAMEQGKEPEEGAPLACGCPSTQVQSFACAGPAGEIQAEGGEVPSMLGHWPVQIKLVPPAASFLKGADLVILADCAAVAYAGLHRDLLANRVVMMGCPKFDDVEEYVQRFTEIFKTAGLRSLTVVRMEVPCCSGLVGVVGKALEAAGVSVPTEEMVIGIQGKVLERSTFSVA